MNIKRIVTISSNNCLYFTAQFIGNMPDIIFLVSKMNEGLYKNIFLLGFSVHYISLTEKVYKDPYVSNIRQGLAFYQKS